MKHALMILLALTLLALAVTATQVRAPSIYTPYAFTNFAGLPGVAGTNDGTGSAARFGYSFGVAVDSAGSVYVADAGNHTIRKITPAGAVTTLAGSAGQSGSDDGTGSAGRFHGPRGVAVDGAGNVYVADSLNQTIRKITSAGDVTTLAGTAGELFPLGADGTGSAARFYWPYGVAVDSATNVYVADTYNSTIRKITPVGEVTTLAGSAGQDGGADGPSSASRFRRPSHVAVDSGGNVYVTDYGGQTIRKITPAGAVTTLAGSYSQQGGADGTGSAARFYYPYGVAVDSAGYVYVAEYGNFTIRKITPDGTVTTVAGSTLQTGSVDGTGGAARFNGPTDVAVDSTGDLYVADRQRITKGTPPRPQLGLARVGNQTLIFWSTNAVGFQLESATGLSESDAWSAVTNSVVVVGDQNTVAMAASGVSKFYRLNKQ